MWLCVLLHSGPCSEPWDTPHIVFVCDVLCIHMRMLTLPLHVPACCSWSVLMIHVPDYHTPQVARLPSGSQQPFYHVLVDLRDRPGPQTTYVAQDNILLLSERPPAAASASATPGDVVTATATAAAGAPPSCTSPDQPVHHPDVGKYMAAWVPGPYDAAVQQWLPGWYTPAPWLQRGFPQG